MDPSVTLITVALAAGGLLAGGGAALAGSVRIRLGQVVVQALAGGALVALVATDLLPDAISAGPPVVVPVVIAVLGFASSIVPGDSGCCSPRVGAFAVAGLALHGVVEGAVLGLGLGLAPAAGLMLLAAFCLHKFAEGFAIVAALRSGGASLRRTWGWMGIAAVAPMAGALAGRVVAVPERISPLVAALLTGVLLAIAGSLIRPVLRRAPEPVG
ncbi:MAG: hypothetical protein JWN00_5245 [Actinomycetia bacterium]|jgi:zinc transporter ZupT|nr:hypothetical protein [Actinomycetes bacterium]